MKIRVRIIFWTVLLLVLPLRVEAGPVDASRAGEVARAFFRNDPKAAGRNAKLEFAEGYRTIATKSGASDPAFYVFNREGGGFVIVAGDDRCKPILGYSFDNNIGSFDRMPEGLRDWIAGFEAQVAAVRSGGVKPQEAETARNEWNSVQYATKAGADYKTAVHHNTALFDQGAPFNGFCPVIGGSSAVGCVPVAMGIIMEFFKYPAKGSGTLPSYTYEYGGYSGSVDGFALGHEYQWDKIKDSYSKGYTKEEADAVARLLFDIGVSAEAWYLPGLTDTNFWRLIPAVIKHFGYDPNVTHLKRWYFTDEQWMDMIKADLQDHPIIYAANAEDAGHAFVVDGYDSKDNLSINWGWGGSDNGYFALSAFAPNSSSKFYYEHTTVLGLVPDKGAGGQPDDYLTLVATRATDGTLYNGLSVNGIPERGSSFKMSAVWLANGGVAPIKGSYFFALVDSQGNLVEKVSREESFGEIAPLTYSNIWEKDCKISVYPMEGDKIVLFYRCDHWPSDVWKTPLYDLSAGIVAEIALKPDDTDLSKVTTLRYDISSQAFALKTKDRIVWTLKNSSQSVVAEGVSKDFQISLPSSGMPEGSYTLTLTRGKEKQVLTLKLGK